MNRLIQKDEQGNWSLKGVKWENLYEGQTITKEIRERLYGALWKLMEYENIELEPEEIISLNEFENGNGQKLLLEIAKHKWIPVEERLPENEMEVEITYMRKHCITGDVLYLTARAFYEDGKVSTEDSGYCWENTDNWEYDEGKDASIIPEGWFEFVSFSEVFGSVDDKVIAWRTVQEPYHPDKCHGCFGAANDDCKDCEDKT